MDNSIDEINKTNKKMDTKNNTKNILSNTKKDNISETQKKDANGKISSDTIKILNLLNEYEDSSSNSASKKKSNETNNENKKDYSYNEIKALCLKLFMLYAKPTKTKFYLSKTSVFKLLREIGILNNNCLSNVDAEILIQQVIRKNDRLDSNQFLDLLVKICCSIDNSFYEDKKNCFINMTKMFIEPYLKKIGEENKLNNNNNNNKNIQSQNFSQLRNKNEKNNTKQKNIDLNNSSINNSINMNLNFKDFILNEYELDKDSYDILFSIIEGLKHIYNSYFFCCEISLYKDIKRLQADSYKIFIKLLKDLEITPYLLKQRLAELYWSIIISTNISKLYKNNNNKNEKNFNTEELLSKNNFGKLYTFPKFFLLFSHISSYYYYPISSKSQGEKLLYFIEKIYKSKGYQNLPNIFSKTYNKKFSIIPPFEIVQRINKNLLDKPYKDEVILSNRQKYKDFSNFHGDLQKFLGINDENYNILIGYVDKLRNVFDIYCQIMDKFQFGKMTFSNYQKMLADGDLLYINNSYKYKHALTRNASMNFGNNRYLEMYRDFEEKNLTKSNSQENYQNQILNKTYNPKNNINNNCDLSQSKTINNGKKLKTSDINIIIATVCGVANNTKHFDYQDIRKKNYNYNQNHNYLNETSKISSSTDNFNLNFSVDEKKKNFLNLSYNRQNPVYKLDFFLFLRTLPMIALKIYPNETNDIDIATKIFLTNNLENFLAHIIPMSLSYSQNYEISNLLKIVETNDKLIQLKKDIEPLINNYYIIYCDSKKNCDFYSFVHFFKDYDIYPYWISLATLTEIYNGQIFKINQEKYCQNLVKKEEKISLADFMECFVIIGLCMNSGDDLDLVDKVLFMIDKMFSDNYGKVVKKIRNLPSFKNDYLYHEKTLRAKYPQYYERKYSNCRHRYDNKFFWLFEKKNNNNEKNNINNNNENIHPKTQADYGELFMKEKVKFDDIFDDLNFSGLSDHKPINEAKEKGNEN